jgi:hypothetical protein
MSALVAVGLAACWGTLRARAEVEGQSRGVEILVDYDEVVALGAAAGRSVHEALAALRDDGVVGVAVPEDSIASLVETGRAAIVAAPSSAVGDSGLRAADSSVVLVRLEDAEQTRRVLANLRTKWRVVSDSVGGDPLTIAVAGSHRRVIQVGVGWDPARVQAVVDAGLVPVGRPLDSPVISEEGIRSTLAQLQEGGMGGVLFQGKFVLGNRDLIGVTGDELRARGLRYYAIELDVQEGTEQLSRLLDGRTIRTHSIGEAELAKMTPDSASLRYGRGVRERGIRGCFVRLFLDRACADPMELNLDYIADVRREITSARMAVGPAGLPPEFNLAHSAAPLIGLGAAGGLGLLILLLAGASGASVCLMVASALLCPALARAGGTGRELCALLTAIAFPTLGVLAARLDQPGGRPWARAALALLIASAAAVAGGLLVAALLSDTLTMVRVAQFRGTKAALAGPVLLVAAVYGLGLLPDGRTPAERARDGVTRLRAFLAVPISLWLLLVVLVGGAAGAYWLARSGNAGASAQSGLEKAMRESLEAFLVYRPRTKEFLLGHPALVLGAFAAGLGRTGWATPLGLLAAVGATSLLNTFCHFHSPLNAILLRSAYGIILGGALGAAACAVGGRWIARGTGGERRA